MPAESLPRVADLMATDIITAPEATLAFEVARRMEREKLRHVLVEKEGELLGIVDRSALLRHLVAHYRQQDADRPIADFVLRNPITTTPTARADEAIRLMRQHRIGSLPVVEGARLVGLLSERLLLVVAETLLSEMAAKGR